MRPEWKVLDEKVSDGILAAKHRQNIVDRVKGNIKRLNRLSDDDIRKKFYRVPSPDADPASFSSNKNHEEDPLWLRLSQPGYPHIVTSRYLHAVPYTSIFLQGVEKYLHAIATRTMTEKEYDWLLGADQWEVEEHLWETTPREPSREYCY